MKKTVIATTLLVTMVLTGCGAKGFTGEITSSSSTYFQMVQ